MSRSHVDLHFASECSDVQDGRDVCGNQSWPLLMNLRCGRKELGSSQNQQLARTYIANDNERNRWILLAYKRGNCPTNGAIF